MKKFFRLIPIIFVIIGMVGCDLFGGNTTNTSTSQTTTQTTTSTTATTTTATTTLEVTTTEELSELTIQLMYIYDLAVEAEAFDGTYEEWLETVRGPEGLPGDAGKEVTLQVSEGYIQWQYIGDTLWVNLVSLESLTGSDGVDGKEVNFQVSEGYIQWQYTGDTTWTNLIELATLVGPAGSDGLNGIDGKEVTFQVSEGYIQWQYLGDTTWTNLIELATLVGPAGADGLDGIDGKEVTFQVSEGYIQWQYTGDTTWTNLIELATLVGPAGSDGLNGIDGKEVTFQVSEGYIQWQYSGDTTWTNLIELATLVGPAGSDGLNGIDGKEVTFQVSEGYIQWQYIGDTTWTNLIELATLVGPAGADGLDGIDGKEVTFQVSEGYIQWQYIGDTTWTNLIELATLVGPQGETGNGIASAVINETGELVITYTDSTVVNLGQLLKVYQVVFKDYNGYVLDAIHVLHGFGVTAPDNPSRIGYTFSEWNQDFSAVTGDLVVNAVYTINSYSVTFYALDETTVLKTESVNYGDSATAPLQPIIEGYTFLNWDKDFSDVKSNLDVVALYSKNIYQVIFYDYNGSILSIQNIEHGETALAPSLPLRDGYAFDSWDQDFTNITSHTSVYALYVANQYIITYYDRDYEIISTELVNYNDSGTYPASPLVVGYDFLGWDKSVDIITGDIDVLALYEIIVLEVVFRTIEGSVYDIQYIDYGSDASDPGTPLVTGYSFTGWDTDYTNVIEDLNITPVYSQNSYSVKFYDYSGTLIDEQAILYGEDAIDPYSSQSEDLDRIGYDFIGWSESLDNISGDLLCNPIYEVITFEVRFVDDNGLVFDTQTINYGEDAYEPLVPFREGYTFTGWDTVFTEVINDLFVSATYSINSFSVSFYDMGSVLIETVVVDYHHDAVPPVAPTVTGFSFTGWHISSERVESDLDVYAIYEINTYTVVFYDMYGAILRIQTVDYNYSATAPVNMEVIGYQFTGWDRSYSNVTSDMHIHPEYTIDQYTVTFDSNGGDAIGDITEIDYNSTISVPIPTKLGYKFLGWFLGETENDAKFYATTKVTSNLTLYARWELATYTVAFYDYDDTLLRSLQVGHGYSAIPPLDPSRTGYDFTGWSESLLSVVANLDVYAVYEAIIYPLIIEENGGENVDDYGIPYETEIGEIEEPVRIGYTFIGYFEDSALTIPFTTVLMPLNGMTIYAKWIINQYTISFEENGGSLVTDITEDYDTVVTEPEDPTQLAKNFLGWYIDPEFSELYVFSTMPAEDITVYAKWEDTLYTISFEENGGSEVAEIIDIYQATVLEPAEPTRDGHIFDGFYEDAGFTTPYVFGTMPLGGDTVYVKWLVNEYELSYISYQHLDIKLYSTNYHSIFVTQDNQVFTIGGGGSGQLGNGASANSTVLINITDSFGFSDNEEVIFVKTTDNSSYLLTSLGRVFTWGRNDVAQLGDGTQVNKLVPTDITGLFSLQEGEIINKLSVSARTGFAITSANRVFAWGYNGYKQLILPSVTYQLTPVDITDLLNNYGEEYIVMIAAGENYTFFMTNAQRVLSIGANWSGCLGNGSTTQSTTLVDITANFGLLGIENIVYIGAGYEFNGALTETGRVFMWGRNDDYQLGIEVLSEKHTPYETTSFFDLGDGEYIIELSIQYSHSVALTNLGRIFVWGSSSSYQTGTGNTTDVYAPRDITSSFRLFEDETLISLGVSNKYANLVKTSLGRYFAFGNNGAGGLLDSPTLKYTPTITYIREFTKVGSDMFDFGETIILPNDLINTGYSIEDFYMDSDYTTPYNLTTMPSEAKDIYVKWTVNQYTITFDSNGGSAVTTKTQDYNSYLSSPTPTKTGYSFAGWFVDSGLTDDYVFAYMEDINMTLYAKWTVNSYNIQYYDVYEDLEFEQISSGIFTIALTTSGQLLSWGNNTYGQLGDGTTTHRLSPVDITKNFDLYQDEFFISVSGGYNHGLVVTSLGRVFTWGSNADGELGTGNTTSSSYPVEITSQFGLIGDEKIVEVYGGDYVSYAKTSTGRLFAWGYNSDYRIGDGTFITRYIPKDITPYFNLNEGETISQMHPGNRSSLAVTSEGRIFTWGYDGGYGVLARGDIYTSSLPYDVTSNFAFNEGETIVELSFGKYDGVVITSEGRVITWGYNDYYELATGDDLIKKIPVDVTANFGFAVGEVPVQATMGDYTMMILTSTGRILAIGRNSAGAMATGDTVNLTIVTDVTNNFSLAVGDSIIEIIQSRLIGAGLAITANGKLIVWGYNGYGQLGDGTTTDRLLPVEIIYTNWSYYNSSNFDYLETIILLADPAREGYSFDGWYTDKDYTTAFTLTEMPGDDIILYAKWTEIPT